MEQKESAAYEKAAEIVDIIYELLVAPRLAGEILIDPYIKNNSRFEDLYAFILELRELSHSLNRGELQKNVSAKGYVLANLKALQSNLRHLTWQTKKIAEGDFSQKVDFLGEFSDSFNIMAKKLDHATKQLHILANIDSLTKIPNRMNLEIFFEDAFARARKFSLSLSIILFDIDNLKYVNDTYGHKIGDTVLIEAAQRLESQIRSTDMLARYAGDEFIAVLPAATTKTAYNTAMRAINAISAKPFEIKENLSISLTASAGISELRESDSNFSDIISRSDSAMYEAKNNGRNRVCAQRGRDD